MISSKENYVDGFIRVYNNEICNVIDNIYRKECYFFLLKTDI